VAGGRKNYSKKDFQTTLGIKKKGEEGFRGSGSNYRELKY